VLLILGAFMEPNVKLGPSDFTGEHLNKRGTLAVLFAADWCPFCMRFVPIFNSTITEKGLSGALADLSDFENSLWEVFGIQVVPTVMVFKEGVLVYRKDGVLGRGLPDNAMNEVVPYLSANHEGRS